MRTAELPAGFIEFLRVEVGSTAHGIGIEGQDDRDEMGVCIEPEDYTLGLQHFEQHQYRSAWTREGGDETTQPQPRSQAGDLDLVVYSFRKWCRMALTGNPTAMLLLFSPSFVVDTPAGQTLRRSHDAFFSRRAGLAYLNYCQNQRERLEGLRGQKNVTRAELVQRHGYDTKYAAHITRLGIQGCEYMRSRQLILPLEGLHRELILSIRRGEVPLKDVLDMARARERMLATYMADETIPDEPNYAVVNDFLVRAYRTVYLGRALSVAKRQGNQDDRPSGPYYADPLVDFRAVQRPANAV